MPVAAVRGCVLPKRAGCAAAVAVAACSTCLIWRQHNMWSAPCSWRPTGGGAGGGSCAVLGRLEGGRLPAGSGGGASRACLAARQHSLHPAYIRKHMREHTAGMTCVIKSKSQEAKQAHAAICATAHNALLANRQAGGWQWVGAGGRLAAACGCLLGATIIRGTPAACTAGARAAWQKETTRRKQFC